MFDDPTLKVIVVYVLVLCTSCLLILLVAGVLWLRYMLSMKQFDPQLRRWPREKPPPRPLSSYVPPWPEPRERDEPCTKKVERFYPRFGTDEED